MNYQELEIIAETNHFIVVVKPSGVLSQGDITHDENMVDLIKEYLVKKYNKQGNAYLGLIHRLDRMTSGLMVFGKTSKGACRICEQIRNHDFKKHYITLVEGIVLEDGILQSKLSFDENQLKAYVDFKHGKEAILSYHVLGYNQEKKYTYLEIDLKTGRHHQIRAQLSSINHPLVGDTLYGSSVKQNILLHAYKIEFNDPVTKEKLEYINYPKWYERKE